VFLNNVSIGFYGAMVSDPHYRSHRLTVTARYVRRAVLGGGTPLHLTLDAGSRVVPPHRVVAVLVSNNAYSPGMAPGASLRPRLDEGLLWVHLLGVNDRHGPVFGRMLRAAGSLLLDRAPLAVWPTAAQTVRADRERLRIGVDGEAAELSTPLEFACRPGALRLLTPPRPAPAELRLEMHT
jgi:diacylglycerol kinase family enzyme